MQWKLIIAKNQSGTQTITTVKSSYLIEMVLGRLILCLTKDVRAGVRAWVIMYMHVGAIHYVCNVLK